MVHMKTQFSCLTFVLLAGWALSVHAQTVWTYEVVGPDNKPTITFKPTTDISYPAANAPASIYNPNVPRGVLMTAQEAAARRSAPMLIIMLGTGIR
jgi:hypothetical protein